LPKLKTIVLHSNELTKLESESFTNLSEVANIDLSLNNIQQLPKGFIKNCPNLIELSLTGNQLIHLTTSTFDGLTTNTLILSCFSSCCLVNNNIKCVAKKDRFDSCSNLLLTTFYRIVCIIISLALVLLGVVNICLARGHKSEAFKIVIHVINASSLLLGIYLLILWIADIMYKHYYLAFDKAWRSSNFCLFLHWVILTFKLLYSSLLNIAALSRLMVVIYPIESKFKQKEFTRKVVCGIVSVPTLLVAGILLVLHLHRIIISFRLCFSFVDPDKSHVVTHVFVWIFFLYDLICIVTISVLYVATILSFRKSQQNISASSKNKKSVKPMIIQITIIIVSCIISLIPVNIVYITALYLNSSISLKLIVFMTVIVMPVNPVVNSLIFIVTSIRK